MTAQAARRTATPTTARLINDRLAFDLLLDRGPLTRAQLRALTGLSGPTVADLVHRLEAAGLVAPVGEAGTERRGPNATLYGVVADRAFVAGVEVRSDRVVAVLADATGHQVGEASVTQDPDVPPDQIVGTAVDGALVDSGLVEPGPVDGALVDAGLVEPGPVDAGLVDAGLVDGGLVDHGLVGAGRIDDRLRMVVVGTPGLVDPGTGDLSFVASLPTWHANVLPGLRRRYTSRVLLENEVNLAALAEHRLGAARGRDTFALLWLDTGIGAAVVLGGELLRGASGGVGELAYLPTATGRFQDAAGGAAVTELAATYLGGVSARLEDGTRSPGALVAAAADTGTVRDSSGAAFLDALADRVVAGAAALCAVLDPGYLVLAGAVGRAGGEQLANRVAERLARVVPLPTAVVPATVGDSPVLRGAVLVALGRVHRDTFAG